MIGAPAKTPSAYPEISMPAAEMISVEIAANLEQQSS